jgi:hypothetical protein
MLKPLKFTSLSSLPSLSMESALFIGATGTVKATEAPAPAAAANLGRLDVGLQLELAVGLLRVVRGGLELVVLLLVLGDQLLALEFALDEGSFSHGRLSS